MIKQLNIKHLKQECCFEHENKQIEFTSLTHFKQLSTKLKLVCDMTFKLKENHLIRLRNNGNPSDLEWYKEVIRVCPGGILKLSHYIVDYELSLIYKNKYESMKTKENGSLFYFPTADEIVENIMKIISIVFVVVNHASDSTLGNYYELKYFKKGLNYLPQSMDKNDLLSEFGNRHTSYIFEFLERIDFKISDYILNFLKIKPKFGDHEDTWFHDEPFCMYLLGEPCCFCKFKYSTSKMEEDN